MEAVKFYVLSLYRKYFWLWRSYSYSLIHSSRAAEVLQEKTSIFRKRQVVEKLTELVEN
jgi:hypothetical protein